MIIRTTILFMLSFLSFSRSLANDIEILDNGSTAGYITLGWSAVQGNNFELKEKNGAIWKLIYKGEDHATTLSGLANGSYEYQLTADGKVSENSTNITIQHHSIKRAWLFFSIGAVMFFILILILALGEKYPANRKYYKG